MSTATKKEEEPSPAPLTKGKLGNFTVRVINDGRGVAPPDSFDAIRQYDGDEDAIIWLDIVAPTKDDLDSLHKEFGFSTLALEDAATPHERPKIDPYDDYWFLVLLATTPTDNGIAFHQLAVFSGKNVAVTIHHEPPFPLKGVEERITAHPDRCRHGAGFLLYTLLDAIVDQYIPVAELFVERVEGIEDRLFEAGTQMHKEVLPEIFKRKKEAQAFRRAAVPMRDVLNQIIREDVKIFPEEEMPYFRDVYDHCVRVIDELDSARDLVQGALDIQLSVTANRQNEINKQLTIIATIFLPLSFLTGFFGQNFTYLVSHISGAAAFFWLGIGTEVLAIAALAIFFKLRGWF